MEAAAFPEEQYEDHLPFNKRILFLKSAFEIGKKKNQLHLCKRAPFLKALLLGKKAALMDSLRLGKRSPKMVGKEQDGCPDGVSMDIGKRPALLDSLRLGKKTASLVDSMRLGKRQNVVKNPTISVKKSQTLRHKSRKGKLHFKSSSQGKRSAAFKDSLRLGKRTGDCQWSPELCKESLSDDDFDQFSSSEIILPPNGQNSEESEGHITRFSHDN